IPGDSYLPAALMIEVGQTVTWVNKDSDPHVTASALGAPEEFILPTASGKSSSFKFTKPGLYPYYCVDHATYNAKLRRAVARKEPDAFTIAMDGLVVVTGPGITGAPPWRVPRPGAAYGPPSAVV